MANFLKTSGNIFSNAASKISGGDQNAAPPAPKKDIQTVSCPNCANPLVINKKSGSVSCDVCENVYTIEQLTSGTAAAAGTSTVSAAAAAQLIESPDSGLIYVRNYFDNVTWEDYCESTALLFGDLEEVVEKSKIKHGANPSAWLLDFESVSFPLSKKLEGLSALAALIAKKYEESSDKVEAMETFNLYRAICASIIDARDTLIKRMETDIAYAEKLEMEADSLAGMQATFAALKEALAAVKLFKTIREVPEVAAIQKKVDEQLVRDFAARGINVRDVYAKACAMAQDPHAPRGEVLGLFEMVRGYADADDRIAEINRYYKFEEYIHVCGKSFVKKQVSKASLFDPSATGPKKDKKDKALLKKKKKKSANEPYNPEEEFNGDTISLYEVIDGKPAKEPLIENITAILDVYATRLYFIRFDAILCYYDIEKKRTVELDRGRIGDYNVDRFYYDASGTIMYMLKKLPLEETKQGCIQKLFKKDELIERKNNYSLLKISLLMDYAGTVIPALVNVSARFGRNLFYTKAEELSAEAIEAKKKAAAAKKKGKETQPEEEEELKLFLRVYDTETGEDRELLSDECEIRGVVGDRVIYTKYTPNELNRDLFVFCMADGKTTLIESNIYDFFTTIRGRIYYTVGNEDYCPLFSNDFTGNDRVEIMQNIEKIVGIRAGWMYAIKGSQYNPTLIKISSDGKRRIVVCTQLSNIIEITDTHIYYIDTESSLRVVCTDGKGNRLIATDIQEDQVIVDKECVYYLRHEQVEEKQNDASLYCMDMNGHNVRKLLFNVNAIDDFDEDTIIVKRTDVALFELTIPVDKKNTTRTERRKYTLTHYCTYKKSTGEIEIKLTLGLPGEDEYAFKKGCFGKTVNFNSTYKRIPRKDTFAKKNAAMAGAVFSEQSAERSVKNANNNGGCANTAGNKSNNAGCSNQLMKK
ncbi:MAG: DUF5050 domain-containing protein [Clostridia bacterium]|nr:DUF5050 domain-containing protein [Clostridia bacterium]